MQMSWTWGAFSPKLNQATLFEELQWGSGPIGRAPVSKPGGCGFESRLPCHLGAELLEER